MLENSNSSESIRMVSKIKEIQEGSVEGILDLFRLINKKGFQSAKQSDLHNIFFDTALMCRNESLTNVLELVSGEKNSIQLKNYSLNKEEVNLNMCKISHGDGFKIAMSEGFGTLDVSGKVKTVITFSPKNIEQRSLNKDSSLWQTKPETAKLSVEGAGEISLGDIEMISIRVPKKLFPQEDLTEAEEENNDLQFVVRHFVA